MKIPQLNHLISMSAIIGILLPTTVTLGAPLTILSSNNIYFDDGSGKGIYLTGSHVWNNLQDEVGETAVDFASYLTFLNDYDHNFTRGWHWEDEAYTPLQYTKSSGKYDLDSYYQTYFTRLKDRADDAADKSRGLYLSIMCFQGWSIEDKGGNRLPNPWLDHPYNGDAGMNSNGIDGDTDNDGDGQEIHSMSISAARTKQENYIKKLIDELNDNDNIIWQISNESHAGSVSWQYHMIDFIKSYEAAYKPKQHLVWMEGYEIPNSDLFASNADCISPNRFNDDGHYRTGPNKNTTGRIVILDTDHLWGVGGDWSWIWRSFTRGYHPIYMDPIYELGWYDGTWDPDDYIDERKAMGHTRHYAELMDFSQVTPQNGKASSGFCLADPGDLYLAYQNSAGTDLTIQPLATGEYYYQWIDPVQGTLLETGTKTGNGSNKTFNNPSSGQAALYVVNIDDGIWVNLERFQYNRGLRQNDEEVKGQTQTAKKGGRYCRMNDRLDQDRFMYFDVEDDWAYQGSKTEIWITVTYYDNSTSGYIRVAYDGSSDTYTQTSNQYLTGTNTWLEKTWHITDAYFGNRQTDGHDFRIYRNDYSIHFYIDKVAVSETDPSPGPPGQATNPSPADQATGISLSADLSWTAGSGATSHDVYFGTTSPGTFQGNQSGTTFDPGTMTKNTTYYWRIDEKNDQGTTTGTVWSFTTYDVPGQASNPSPANSATDISVSADLSWTAGTNAESHDVYFGTSSPGTFQGNQAGTTFDPGTMSNSTTYYWRIDEKNEAGTTTGTVWSFTTGDAPPCHDDWVAIDVGATDNESCLYRSNEGSNQSSTTSATIVGRDCRTNLRTGTDRYFYYDVEDDWAYQGSKTEVWVTINYYDNSSTGFFRCAYDGASDSTTQTSELYLSGDNTWKYHTWHITDAYFGNRQNGGSDFRIYRSYYDINFYIDKVRVSAVEPDTVYVDLGATDIEDGLNRPSTEPGDGDTISRTKDSRPCRRNSDNTTDYYIYFQVDDNYAYQGDRSDVYITIDWYDNTTTGIYRLQYDGASAAYTNASPDIDCDNTDTWYTYTWHVTDAYFGNRENRSSDFRIYRSDNQYMFLDVVEVSNVGWVDY